MPEARLQRTREAYQSPFANVVTTGTPVAPWILDAARAALSEGMDALDAQARRHEWEDFKAMQSTAFKE